MLKCVSLINENVTELEDEVINEEFDDTLNDFKLNTRCIGVRCAAHTLQLAVNCVLKEKLMEKVTSTVRTVVKKLRTPNVGILLKNEGLNKPTIDCVTRWSSTYEMLESINGNKIKQFCQEMSQKSDDFFISQEMWKSISDAVDTLRPANIATKTLQMEQLTFGDAYAAWCNCKLQLQKIKTNFSNNLIEHMKNKENILFENDAFIGAIFMDPRWNVVLKNSLKERAIEHVISVIDKMNSLTQTDCILVTDGEMNNSSSSIDSLEAILQNIEKENYGKNASIRELLNEFSKEKRLCLHDNVIQWWEDRREIKSQLYNIAMVLLAVPATQVSVERLFSGVKFLMNPSRNRLDEDSLNAIVVIRSNKDLF
ncbi:uncharacterized protein LOC119603395 [Lucilia sericata]|nr:uncharacterized protein LOC119603395 [Lucilia sericata]